MFIEASAAAGPAPGRNASGAGRHQPASAAGAAAAPARSPRPAPRNARSPRWGRRIGLAAVLVAAIGLVPVLTEVGGPAVAITVDFDDQLVAVPRESIGFTATTFDVEGGTVVDNANDAAALGRLGAGAVRIHLRATADGSVVTGAAGGILDVPAQRWLQAYAGMDLQPTVVLDLDRAGALAVQRQLRRSGLRVHRYVLGNEMDANSRSDVTGAQYVRTFRDIAAAMRAVDPSLQIGGPAPAHFEGLDAELVDGLLGGPVAGRASFIDFHSYGAGEGERATMDSSWRYGEQLDRLRKMIDDPAVELQVGEYNLNWADDPQDNTQAQAVWVASALGTILSRGAVAFLYGDKNQALGLVADGVPKPSYRGMAAFTGGGQFRPFGSMMVRSSSSDPAVRVFASAGEANIVIVNTGPATPCRLRLAGFGGGRATVWQDEGGGFRRIGQLEVEAAAELPLPPNSITTLVFEPARQN
jgi:hypothetical protein